MKLLNIQKEIPDILLEIRYCTTYNFIGEIIDGYIDPVALGTKELVEQLKIINSKARQMGYRLKIWDAYRPQSALDHFMAWKDTEDDQMKSIFYPNDTDPPTPNLACDLLKQALKFAIVRFALSVKQSMMIVDPAPCPKPS